MEKKKYRFKGHESFILREGWLNKGLAAVESDERLFFQNRGADELGVGVNMAKSIRYWLYAAGLTQERKHGITLSETGKLILECDPYLEDIFSLWVIHCNLVKNKENVTTWNLFFNAFRHQEFSSEELKQEMMGIVAKLPDLEKYSTRSIYDDCDAILRMYVKAKQEQKSPEEKNSSPFSVLGLIRQSNGRYRREQPAVNKVPEHILWYLMPSDTDSISMEELLEGKNSPGKLLHIKRNLLLELLEKLAVKNIVEIHRTAGLDMVYRKEKKSKEEIIQNYFQKRRKIQ